MSQPGQSLDDLIGELETEVKQARKAKIIPTILAAATAAMDQLEQAVNNPNIGEADRQRAQTTAKKLGYNAAADAWPFWECPPAASSSQDLLAARALAMRAAALVEILPPDPKQSGNAAWLIGALDLALGDIPSAQSHFQAARTHFEPVPEMRLMTEGYLAITGALGVPPLEATIQTLKNSSLPHAGDLAEQLGTAHKAIKQAALF